MSEYVDFESANMRRLVDGTLVEDGIPRNPLEGMFRDLSRMTLRDALYPIIAKYPFVSRFIDVAEVKVRSLNGVHDELDDEEKAAIVLYTMEATPREESVSSDQ
jgi:hypothetical protein